MIKVQRRWTWPVTLAAFLIASHAAQAQDKIVLKDGSPSNGEITAYDPASGAVTFKNDKGTVPYPAATLSKVELGERPEFAKGVAAVSEERYAEGVDLLKPLVDKFLGIDSPWVPQAAAYLADALAKTGKTFDSEQLADKIVKSYPNSIFRYQGMISKAASLSAKKNYDEALTLLAEVEKAVPQTAAPDARTMQILGDLFYNRAIIYKAKGDKAKAYESFLTVSSLYHKPAKRAKLALAEAEALRKENKDLFVN
ncbi:MAG: tetratricopeptide repeat protein [Candidatus Methylacidiphilales bacterium]|nr:tetratricopeptide repeat protein [Candidatus Methylacidiphilales bacterium]